MTAADPTPAQLKECCAAAYGSDLVALLLGDAYHPGGLALTSQLAGLLGLTSADRVLDVAAGRGTTALLLASEHGATVTGVDLSAANVATAEAAAAEAGLSARVTFTTGDAERLPFPAAAFDAVVCECAFCTFPDKPTAAAELARVLRPGGRVGITDVVADTARLPDELRTLTAWVACVADARPMAEYAAILTGAGLRVIHTEQHDPAIIRMIDQIEARVSLLRITNRTMVEGLGLDFDRAPGALAAARAAIAGGVLGYGLLVAAKPA